MRNRHTTWMYPFLWTRWIGYELLHDDPTYYTNRHIDDTWDMALRRHDSIAQNLGISYGAEALAGAEGQHGNQLSEVCRLPNVRY